MEMIIPFRASNPQSLALWVDFKQQKNQRSVNSKVEILFRALFLIGTKECDTTLQLGDQIFLRIHDVHGLARFMRCSRKLWARRRGLHLRG